MDHDNKDFLIESLVELLRESKREAEWWMNRALKVGDLMEKTSKDLDEANDKIRNLKFIIAEKNKRDMLTGNKAFDDFYRDPPGDHVEHSSHWFRRLP